MANSSTLQKEPIVRAISNHIDILGNISGTSKLRPTLGHDTSIICATESIQNGLVEGIGVFDNNGTKPNIDRGRSSLQKFEQVVRGSVVGRQVKEEETSDIDMVSPILGFTNQVRRPGVGMRDLSVIEKRTPTSSHNLFQTKVVLSKGVAQISQTAPCEGIHQAVTHHILGGGTFGIAQVRQRMRESSCGRPGHGKEDVQRATQPLSHVVMPKGRRVGQNSMGAPRLVRKVGVVGFSVFGVNDRFGISHSGPATLDNFFHHHTLSFHLVHTARHEPRMFHHVSHQLFRVTSNWGKLNVILDNELLENSVARKTYTMAKLPQLFSQSHKWLDITTRTNNQDGNVHEGHSAFISVGS
mmetsp:Transcript_31351/g.48949  ORF Transcript_31351/g.48949 Transcript_31351/m.48949 type:complete len:355 (-) Transcript_31351:500-1564(-)